MKSSPEVVIIIGGSFAGILTAHAILKTNLCVGIILISRSSKFFFNIAAPRILAKPNTIKDEEYLLNIPQLFTKHTQDKFNFVEGTGDAVDYQRHTISLQPGTLLNFDSLIIASGSTTLSSLEQDSELAPWKYGNTSDLISQIRQPQTKISEAKSIILGGSGPVGIFAGELAESTGLKAGAQITLTAENDCVLPDLAGGVGARAENVLKRNNVTIVKGAKVINTTKMKGADTWEVTLGNGMRMTADPYISTTGVVPTTSYLPKEMLSTEGWVTVDQHMRVKRHGNTLSGSEDTHDDSIVNQIYAVGDVADLKPRTVNAIKEQIPVLVPNLRFDVDQRHNGLNATEAEQRSTYIPKPTNGIMIPSETMVERACSAGVCHVSG